MEQRLFYPGNNDSKYQYLEVEEANIPTVKSISNILKVNLNKANATVTVNVNNLNAALNVMLKNLISIHSFNL